MFSENIPYMLVHICGYGYTRFVDGKPVDSEIDNEGASAFCMNEGMDARKEAEIKKGQILLTNGSYFVRPINDGVNPPYGYVRCRFDAAKDAIGRSGIILCWSFPLRGDVNYQFAQLFAADALVRQHFSGLAYNINLLSSKNQYVQWISDAKTPTAVNQEELELITSKISRVVEATQTATAFPSNYEPCGFIQDAWQAYCVQIAQANEKKIVITEQRPADIISQCKPTERPTPKTNWARIKGWIIS